MNYPQNGYPQQPPAPGYNQGPGYQNQPQQGYGPPQGYQQQGGYQAPPPSPVLARGTLEDYLDQPTPGGGAATSKFFTPQRPIGSWLQLRISRNLTNSDVRQQTDKFGTPLVFKTSGKPKFVLVIPCDVLGSNDGSHVTAFPEGKATIWLKGVPADSFKAAIAQAGLPDPDKVLAEGRLEGASLYMIGAGTKQFGQGNPANMFDFQYTPGGHELERSVVPDPTSAPAQYAPVTSAPPTTPPAPPVQQQVAPPTPPPGYAPQGAVPPGPQGYAQQPPAAGPGQPQLDAEKIALLQRLQGQQQG